MRSTIALIALACAACDVDPAPDHADGGVAAATALWTELTTAADDPAPRDDGLATREDALICWDEDWRPLHDFQFNASYRVGAQFGTGVAKVLNTDDKRCTGFLYDDRYLATAEHCRHGTNAITAQFGRFPGAREWAIDRLQDLGMDAPLARGLREDDLFNWTCWYRQHYDLAWYGDRDLAVYECGSKNFPQIGWLKPGQLWDHLEVAPGRRDEGRGVYVVSDNHREDSDDPTALRLSPGGEVTDRYDDDCYPTSGHDNCFEHDADTLGGSSGGPIFDRTSNRVFGVVMGHYGVTNHCDISAANYGTYLVSEDQLPTRGHTPDRLPGNPDAAVSPWIGGVGGTLRSYQCPEGQLAIGVVGTSYPFDDAGDARVGNFGLVCAPFDHGDDLLDRPTHLWTVVAGGSIDTGFQTGVFDYNTYLNEVLDLNGDDGNLAPFADQRQSVTICKPGEYVTGAAIKAGRYIDEIEYIECQRTDGRGFQARFPRKPLGSRDAARTQYIRCPHSGDDGPITPHRAIRGLFIRSGWLTDGMQFYCQAFRAPYVRQPGTGPRG